MNTNEHKNYWPMISLLMIVIIVALGYFMVYPNIGSLRELNIQIAAKAQEIEAMEKKIADLQNLKKDFSEKEEEVKLLDLALPQEDAMAETLSSLEMMAAGSSLGVTSVVQKKSTKDTKYTPVELDFEGTYESLRLFLEDLATNIRQVQVNNISLSQVQNQEDVIKGKMSLEFFRVDNAKVSAQPTAVQ